MMNNLNPNWITGFTDGEGCFMINITEREANKMRWHVSPCFQIKLHYRDKELLMKIKSFFDQVGFITFSKDNGVMYRVNKLNDIINVIIPHFDKYPLLTQKYSDFILFKNIVELMNKSEHLNKEGLSKITQHSRDLLLMNSIKNILNCGFVTNYSKRNAISLKISSLEDVYYKVIPIFNTYKIIGIKSLDYLDFCLAAELVAKKAHLTLEGIEKIRKIKLRMNKNRYDLYNNQLCKISEF